MGGHPWFYFVQYQPDTGAALRELRAREFSAGRYNPVIPFPKFPVTASSPAPGPRHASIEDALKASGADGTRSILDMRRVARDPGCGLVVPLPGEELLELYGTEQPTREMVEENMEFFADLERGHGIYLTVFENGLPSELLFAGYSYD